MKTKDYLDEIVRRAGLRDTDYALWKHMHDRYGWSRITVVNYRKGATFPSDRHALDIAQELGLDPARVLADITAERAAARGKDAEVAAVWKRIAERVSEAAAWAGCAIMAAAFSFIFAVQPADARAVSSPSPDLAVSRPNYTLSELMGAEPDGRSAGVPQGGLAQGQDGSRHHRPAQGREDGIEPVHMPPARGGVIGLLRDARNCCNAQDHIGPGSPRRGRNR